MGFPGPFAIRTLDIEFHPAARLGYVSTATASWTGPRFTYQAFAAAVCASFLVGDLEAQDGATNSVPETYVDLVFEVRAWFCFPGGDRAPASSKHAGKNIVQASAALSAR